MGLIQSFVSNGGLTVTNVTQPGHIFYDGKAVRTAYQREDGAWYVTTRSYGNNFSINLVTPGPPPGLNPPNTIPVSTATLNEWAGPYVFNRVDEMMLNYILGNR